MQGDESFGYDPVDRCSEQERERKIGKESLCVVCRDIKRRWWKCVRELRGCFEVKELVKRIYIYIDK